MLSTIVVSILAFSRIICCFTKLFVASVSIKAVTTVLLIFTVTKIKLSGWRWDKLTIISQFGLVTYWVNFIKVTPTQQ